MNKKILTTTQIDTPIGPMVAIGDEKELYLLEFIGQKGLEEEIEYLRQNHHAMMVPGRTMAIDTVSRELEKYFKGSLKTFSTPLFLGGTLFQQQVWKELQKIPFGETRSYSHIAEAIGRPTAFRAAAQANGANLLAIIIPCHRVINANGKLGGYAGGLTRKQWLLEHEATNDY